MAGKRILIVDDDESVVFFLGENLAQMGKGYEVEIAYSGEEALARMAKQPFDLLITDLRMPGVDGLELLEQVRARYPDTRLILMTAYGSDKVEAEAHRLEVYRYITKPFEVEELVGVVRQALSKVAVSKKGILVLSGERFEVISQRLSELCSEVGAQCILLADVMGQLITQVGFTAELEVATLVSLIGGSFATVFEMSRLLGEKEAFNLNYHEGNNYDIYSANVGDNLFLALVFDRRAQPSRIGMVWLYTKRAIKDLLKITSEAEVVRADEVLNSEFSQSLSQQLNNLFDDI
jgi:CheY-like chemotaxis protein